LQNDLKNQRGSNHGKNCYNRQFHGTGVLWWWFPTYPSSSNQSVTNKNQAKWQPSRFSQRWSWEPKRVRRTAARKENDARTKGSSLSCRQETESLSLPDQG